MRFDDTDDRTNDDEDNDDDDDTVDDADDNGGGVGGVEVVCEEATTPSPSAMNDTRHRSIIVLVLYCTAGLVRLGGDHEQNGGWRERHCCGGQQAE